MSDFSRKNYLIKFYSLFNHKCETNIQIKNFIILVAYYVGTSPAKLLNHGSNNKGGIFSYKSFYFKVHA